MSLLLNRPVHIRLLQADQYGRGVAEVFVKRRWLPRFLRRPTYADEHMLKAGLAEVYQGGGAVYGPLGKDAYLKLQRKARKEKTGIWSQGKRRESAAEYKARTK